MQSPLKLGKLIGRRNALEMSDTYFQNTIFVSMSWVRILALVALRVNARFTLALGNLRCTCESFKTVSIGHI